MTQVDLANPTLEFLGEDPSIAARFGGSSDSISYIMHTISEWLQVSETVVSMPLMFLFNLLVTWVITYCIYYRFSQRRDYFVSFMLFSSAMFLLLWLMQLLDIQTGFVLGLFAIFGMIRYRTETVPVREMNYLFIVIAVSIMNSLCLKAEGLTWYILLLANIFVIIMACGFELWSGRKRQSTKIILYDKIDLIQPAQRAELIADLQSRTGLEIIDVEIGHIDFLRDVAYIKVTYVLEKGKYSNSIDHITKFKQ